MSESYVDNSEKNTQIEKIQLLIDELGFNIADTDFAKPWGAYFRLDNSEAERFIDTYFADIKDTFTTFEDLSPKFLIVAQDKRLSWQYHYRRAELWRVLEGPVGVKISNDDTEPAETTVLNEHDTIRFDALTRHRLMGAGAWGVVVEIWQHTDHNNLSEEADIVRVQDDFGR